MGCWFTAERDRCFAISIQRYWSSGEDTKTDRLVNGKYTVVSKFDGTGTPVLQLGDDEARSLIKALEYVLTHPTDERTYW